MRHYGAAESLGGRALVGDGLTGCFEAACCCYEHPVCELENVGPRCFHHFFPPWCWWCGPTCPELRGELSEDSKADATLWCCGKLRRASSCWRRIHGVFEAACCCHEHLVCGLENVCPHCFHHFFPLWCWWCGPTCPESRGELSEDSKADATLWCCEKLRRASSCWRRIHGVFEAACCCHEHLVCGLETDKIYRVISRPLWRRSLHVHAWWYHFSTKCAHVVGGVAVSKG